MAATPNTGKTHTRYCRFLADGYDLSGDMRSVGSMGVAYDQSDATGWSNGTKQWLTGWGDVQLTGVQALFNNEATDTGPTLAGAHEVLNAATTVNASVFVGIRKAPEIGSPTFSSPFEQGSYTLGGGGSDPVLVNAEYFASGTLNIVAQVWGVCLANGAEMTATTTNESVDNGASSTNGWVAFLHVTQTAGAQASNDWEFVIEHSANDSDWSTLTTFTADGSAITSERKDGATTANRYVRLKATRTGGTARVWVSFIRK